MFKEKTSKEIGGGAGYDFEGGEYLLSLKDGKIDYADKYLIFLADVLEGEHFNLWVLEHLNVEEVRKRIDHLEKIIEKYKNSRIKELNKQNILNKEGKNG